MASRCPLNRERKRGGAEAAVAPLPAWWARVLATVCARRRESRQPRSSPARPRRRLVRTRRETEREEERLHGERRTPGQRQRRFLPGSRAAVTTRARSCPRASLDAPRRGAPGLLGPLAAAAAAAAAPARPHAPGFPLGPAVGGVAAAAAAGQLRQEPDREPEPEPASMMKFKPNQTRTYDREGFKKRAACLCFRSEQEDEVLLVSSSRYPDQWIVPGGGMEPEEEPGGAAVREVYEEVRQRIVSSFAPALSGGFRE